jgi:hypothetical protein
VRFLEANEIATAVEQGKSKAAISAITMTVAQTDGVKDAPKLEAPKAEAEAPKAEAKAEAEPVKVTAKKEEPAPKKDLTKILSDWDDE